jgi:multidrug resistance efflux pump
MTMKKILFLLFAALLTACTTAAATEAPEANIPVVVDSGKVIAEGKLEPGNHVQLSFLAGGQVAEVLVAEGAAVQSGDVLARLANREALQAQVAQAEQAVLDAQQAVTTLNDIAALAAAQAQQEAAQGRDELEKAERKLKYTVTPDIKFYEDELKRAQDALTSAQENATITNIGDIENALAAARERLKTVTNIFNDAQKSQDECPGCEFVFAAAAGGYVKLEEVRKELTDATDAVKVWELRLAQAQRGDAQTIQDLQKRVDTAKADLANARNPKAEAVSLAQAEVALIKARIADAVRRYEKLKNGPDADQLAAAEARLKSAQANLAAAQAALANTELRAPIAGTVADLNLKVGEQIAPGTPIGALAEFAQWVVKTNNLTEIEVVKIKEGQAATVKLDALPDVTLTGTVKSIATVFVENRGDVTYTLTIALDDVDPRARWGMTAQVTVEP